MAKSATPRLALVLPPAPKPRNPAATTAPVIDIDVRRLGRKTTQTFPGVEAPEGWVKKEDRERQGKVWIGYFHLWTEDASGRRVRVKKEKKLGLATMPKHEAQKKLAEYIEEYTGKLIRQGESIDTFKDLWKAYSAVKAGSWGKKMREDMGYLFDKHVLPVLGEYAPGKITLTPLQLLVNTLAEDGYSKSAVKQIRTYLKSCFEYAVDEDLIDKPCSKARDAKHSEEAMQVIFEDRGNSGASIGGCSAGTPGSANLQCLRPPAHRGTHAAHRRSTEVAPTR